MRSLTASNIAWLMYIAVAVYAPTLFLDVGGQWYGILKATFTVLTAAVVALAITQMINTRKLAQSSGVIFQFLLMLSFLYPQYAPRVVRSVALAGVVVAAVFVMWGQEREGDLQRVPRHDKGPLL